MVDFQQARAGQAQTPCDSSIGRAAPGLRHLLPVAGDIAVAPAGAVLVVDRRRTCLFGNALAQRLVDAAEIVGVEAGRLVFIDPAADLQIDRCLREIGSLGIRERGHRLSTPCGWALDVRVVALSPVLPDAREQRLYALIITADGRRGTAAAVRHVARALGMTPTEQRVLELVCRGMNAVEAAAALGIARSTVRTHLQRLFQKTGTARQSELVGFVASYGLPEGHS